MKVGDKFNRLTVVTLIPGKGSNGKHFVWSKAKCQCVCGTTKIIDRRYLMGGNSKSCGCIRSERATALGKQGLQIKHGHTVGGKVSREYSTHTGMMSRCYNFKDKRFIDYGGRGIRVCKRWFGKGLGFINFLADMGFKPADKTLDRKNPNGNYTPDNCRWATPKEQANNRRNSR